MSFEPDFGTIVDAAAAIRAKQMSSVELTEHTWRRIDAFQPALTYRAQWEAYFESVDVFLIPTTFTTVFPHDRTPPDDRRLLPTPEGRTQPFWDLLSYITPATLTGCPATTAPVGLSRSGLPVGLQIMGPFLEDATPIGFARLLALEIGGFQRPKGYDAAR